MEIPVVVIPILIWGLMFLVIFLLLTGIFNYFRKSAKKTGLLERIEEAGEDTESSKSEGRFKKRFHAFLDSFGRRVVPVESADYGRMKIRFLKAGLHQVNAPAVYWGIKTFLMICLPVFFLACRITVFRLFGASATLTVCVLLALLGFYLPDIWLSVKIAKRRERIIEGLPDALDLLVVCVEAGMGLDSSFNRIAKEISLSNKTLSDELNLMNMELRAGKSRHNALRNLAARTDVEDLNSLVTLLVQADRFGTSVAQALRVYSDSFRTKRYQRAEEIAAKLSVKLVFPCILFIFPSLFVVILGPAAIRIYQTFLHH
jgi:tight adherence protein C